MYQVILVEPGAHPSVLVTTVGGMVGVGTAVAALVAVGAGGWVGATLDAAELLLDAGGWVGATLDATELLDAGGGALVGSGVGVAQPAMIKTITTTSANRENNLRMVIFSSLGNPKIVKPSCGER